MNNVNLVGRLTRTPELREVNRATSVATIFVATDRPKLNKDGHTYKGDDGFTVKETEYHKVTCFNGLAKAIAGNRKKGDLIAIEGRLHYTRWQDSDGTARSLHDDPFGSPVRYASLVPIAPAYRPRPSRSHRGHACACRARYASTGAVRPMPGSLAVPQCLRIASTSYASLGHPVLRTDP